MIYDEENIGFSMFETGLEFNILSIINQKVSVAEVNGQS